MARALYEPLALNKQLVQACLVLGTALGLAAGVQATDPPATSGADAPPAAAPSPSEGVCEPCAAFDWTKVPPVRSTPRLGMFVIYPSGPGYYSLLDQIQGDHEKARTCPGASLPSPPARRLTWTSATSTSPTTGST